MKFPFLASVLLFCMLLSFFIKRSNKKAAEAEANFWEKEKNANFVRKKPLDNLSYVHIPEAFFDFPYNTQDGQTEDALSMLKHLSSQKIVNLTGISNTDLKLKYGTANITVLTEYDQNYTQLVRALQKLADSLHQNGQDEAAREILEFSVCTGTDISGTYYLLADLYVKSGQAERIKELKEAAGKLNSPMVSSILRTLSEKEDAVLN